MNRGRIDRRETGFVVEGSHRRRGTFEHWNAGDLWIYSVRLEFGADFSLA